MTIPGKRAFRVEATGSAKVLGQKLPGSLED